MAIDEELDFDTAKVPIGEHKNRKVGSEMPVSVYSFGIIALWLLVLGVVPLALLCVLQYVLSRQEDPWPGRILPILTGGGSVTLFLVLILNVAAGNDAPRAFLMLGFLLLVVNIPTAIFLVIYHFTRKDLADKRDTDRMDIQDLE